ncbi:T9SS type A sorting domain-containing protein [candidate division KSB1 bacterium]|nr:T9SS type A sorting domain-containing protein [candidate division KSB1 bacterium]
MRTGSLVLLILLGSAGSAAAQAVESGTVRGFLQGSCAGCAYDNWMSHVVEGVARPGYNDFGPAFFDPQLNGFGHFSTIPSTPEGDATLTAWRSVFDHALVGDWSLAETELAAADSAWNYELIELQDTSMSRAFYVFRERLDSSFIDPNVDTVLTDDVIGSFRNGWGVFVFNPAAARPQLVMQVVHPQDDFMAGPIAIEMFCRMDAYLLMIAGASREAVWDSLHPPYDNSKSISDPSRNERTPFHVCFQAVFDARDAGPLSPLVTMQMHSYDTGLHASLCDVQISAFADDQRPNIPLRDLAEHRDLVHYLGRNPLNGISGHPTVTRRVDQYLSLWCSPRYSYFGPVDTLLIPSITDLVGAGVNRQGQYSHTAHQIDIDPEDFMHVELDEYPDGLWTPVQWEDWLTGPMPATTATYALALEYYDPFIAAMDSALQHTYFESDVTAPPAVTVQRVDYAGQDCVRVYWAPPAADRWFDSYRVYYDTTVVSTASPVRTRTSSGLSTLAQFGTTSALLKNLTGPLERYEFAVDSRDLWGNQAGLSNTASVNWHLVAGEFNPRYLGLADSCSFTQLRWNVSDSLLQSGVWQFTLPSPLIPAWEYAVEPLDVRPAENVAEHLLSATARRIGGAASQTIEVQVEWQAPFSTSAPALFAAELPVLRSTGTDAGMQFTTDGDSAWFVSAADTVSRRLMIRRVPLAIDTLGPVATLAFNGGPACAVKAAEELIGALGIQVLRGDSTINAPLNHVELVVLDSVQHSFVIMDSVIAADFLAPDYPDAAAAESLWTNLSEGCNLLWIAAGDAACNHAVSEPVALIRDSRPPATLILNGQSAPYNNTPGSDRYGAARIAGDVDIEIRLNPDAAAVGCYAESGSAAISYDYSVWWPLPAPDLTAYPTSPAEAESLWTWMMSQIPAGANGERYRFYVRSCDCAGNCAVDSFALEIDLTLPENSVTRIDAAPGDLRVWLDWEWAYDAANAVAMEIWRSPDSGEYPVYAQRQWADIDSVDVYPKAYPPVGWTLVVQQAAGNGTNSAVYSGTNGRGELVHGGEAARYWMDGDVSWNDSTPHRDVYRYVAFVSDAAGNWSRASAYVDGQNCGFATNYWLGDYSRDIMPGPNGSAGVVDGPDLGLLAANYFMDCPPAPAIYDIGPTLPDPLCGLGRGVPTPDGRVDFFDLATFSHNFGQLAAGGFSPPAVRGNSGRSTDDGARFVISVVQTDNPDPETAMFAVTLCGAASHGVRVAEATLVLSPATLDPTTCDIEPAEPSAELSFVAAGISGDAHAMGVALAALGTGAALPESTTVAIIAVPRGRDGVATALQVSRWRFYDGVNLSEGQATDAPVIAENSVLPGSYQLYPNYPNPFNASTRIRFDLPESGPVEIRIYNLTGQQVRMFVDEYRATGSYSVEWDGRDGSGIRLGSGLYLLRMSAGDFVAAQKLVLLR